MSVWRFLGVGARRRLRPSDRVAQLTAGARAGARLVVVVGREEQGQGQSAISRRRASSFQDATTGRNALLGPGLQNEG
jgi:beta-phosphoglucomutase-like phosphatase (HAD superfamily)